MVHIVVCETCLESHTLRLFYPLYPSDKHQVIKNIITYSSDEDYKIGAITMASNDGRIVEMVTMRQ